MKTPRHQKASAHAITSNGMLVRVSDATTKITPKSMENTNFLLLIAPSNDPYESGLIRMIPSSVPMSERVRTPAPRKVNDTNRPQPKTLGGNGIEPLDYPMTALRDPFSIVRVITGNYIGLGQTG